MSFVRAAGVRIVAFLLIAEGLLTAARLAGLLTVIAAYDGVALLLIALRGLVAPLQFAGGWLLATRRPPGVPLAAAALVSSAALTVFDVGFALAPSPVYYWLRWQATVAYAGYAAGALLLLSGDRWRTNAR